MGIYHVSINDPDSIYSAFENFISNILNMEAQNNRTSTENFLVNDATIKFRPSAHNKKGVASMYSQGGQIANG